MLEECFRRESGLGLRGMMCFVVFPDSVLMEIPSISVSWLDSRPLKEFEILWGETVRTGRGAAGWTAPLATARTCLSSQQSRHRSAASCNTQTARAKPSPSPRGMILA